MKYVFNPKMFCPLYWHLKPLLQDDKIRYIYIEGGSSASKTFTICEAILVDQYEKEYSTVVFRRQHVDIVDSVYSSYKMASSTLNLKDSYYYFQEDLIKSRDDKASIRFRGLDNEENIKGIESFNIVHLNEWNQFEEDQWGQLRKRLRGRPNQKFICDWNPVSEKLWQYENWLDKDEWIDMPLDMGKNCPSAYSALNKDHSFKRMNKKGDSVWIKVTYRDNFFICGHPSGSGGYRDEHTLADFEWDRINKPGLYRIYADGERGIMRTGGEFWKSFDENKHVGPLGRENTTLHISLDENVNPYITISIWQVVITDKKEARQVGEMPCKSPDNNAPKSAMALAKWLKSINYKDVVYIYGDPSSKKKSTIDLNSKSFYDKFIDVLKDEGFRVVVRVQRSHPQVALSAAFINDVYEHEIQGLRIKISDTCKMSIEDYITVKEEADGTMKKLKVKDKKTGVTYEPNGHLSDAKRYFLTTVFAPEFKRYGAGKHKSRVYSLKNR